VKYDNLSVLENQSADFVKSLLETSLDTLLPSLNIGVEDTLEAKDLEIRRIYDLIIQTDMIYHFGHVEKMNQVVILNKPQSGGSKITTPLRGSDSMRMDDSSVASLTALSKTIIPPEFKGKDYLLGAILHAAGLLIFWLS
jgi:3'5'-cyclic nucleotide phosphodiesterase